MQFEFEQLADRNSSRHLAYPGSDESREREKERLLEFLEGCGAFLGKSNSKLQSGRPLKLFKGGSGLANLAQVIHKSSTSAVHNEQASKLDQEAAGSK